MSQEYRSIHPLEQRKREATKMIEKYPERIPVLVFKRHNSNIKQIDKSKFMVPRDLTMGQFQYIIRRRLNLNSEQALFMFVGNNILLPVSVTIGDAYKNKDEDGFLTVTYSGENTFGV